MFPHHNMYDYMFSVQIFNNTVSKGLNNCSIEGLAVLRRVTHKRVVIIMSRWGTNTRF